jgi:hypothetical protein
MYSHIIIENIQECADLTDINIGIMKRDLYLPKNTLHAVQNSYDSPNNEFD